MVVVWEFTLFHLDPGLLNTYTYDQNVRFYHLPSDREEENTGAASQHFPLVSSLASLTPRLASRLVQLKFYPKQIIPALNSSVHSELGESDRFWFALGILCHQIIL